VRETRTTTDGWLLRVMVDLSDNASLLCIALFHSRRVFIMPLTAHSTDGSLEHNTEDCQNCSVLCWG